MKRIKGYFILSIVTALIMTVIFSSFSAMTAYADVDSEGSQTTALQKLWYATLNNCVGSRSAWIFSSGYTGDSIKPSNIKNFEWFGGNSFTGATTNRGGPYIEYEVTGEFKPVSGLTNHNNNGDGKIYCGENSNRLVTKGLNNLKLSKEEVVCSLDENGYYANSGILIAYKRGDSLGENPQQSCGVVLSVGDDKLDYFEPNPSRSEYFRRLVEQKTFGGNVPAGSLEELTDLERYYVYQAQFLTACARRCEGCKKDKPSAEGINEYNIKEWKDGSFVDVYYSELQGPGTKIFTFNGESATCQELAGALNNGPYFEAYKNRMEKSLTNPDIDDPGISGGPSSIIDPPEVKPNCYNSGAANSLGWIMCPLLEWMTDTSRSLYNDYVRPALEVKPVLFSGINADTGKVAAKDAWGVFQGIANVAFIIILLVVIFSQLTGFGIDNYGIKKLLPKLIIAAILVNLSYYICVICVDLSNILGGGIQAFFEAIPIDRPTEIIVNGSDIINIESGFTVESVGSTSLWGVGLLVVLVSSIWKFAGNMGTGIIGGILLMLIMAAVVVLFAVLFLFLILSVRQAAIIILTVLSPLAFACFILPNTKNLFNKWLKFGWSLLLVYPICGLLVGGGDFASKLLLSVGDVNLFSSFTAMIVGIAPVFLIPTVLKSSLAMAGNIGAKISGLGKTLGRKVGANTRDFTKSRDTFRKMDNALGRHSFSSKRRLQAMDSTRAFNSEKSRRKMYAGGEAMDRAIQSQKAFDEAKEYNEATSQVLALMQSSVEDGGGITVGGERKAYTFDNALTRVSELEKEAQKKELKDKEKLELAALSRGLASMPGGAGKLTGIIRAASAKDENGQTVANSNFMRAMGEIYGRDSAVKSKIDEKDQSVGVYTEHFLSGGDGATGKLTNTYSQEAATAGHQAAVKTRVKSHAAGLAQTSTAAKEYLDGLGAGNMDERRRLFQEIIDNDELMGGLDVDIREMIYNESKTLTRDGMAMKKSARDVTGTVDVGNEVDVNIRQSGEQVNPVVVVHGEQRRKPGQVDTNIGTPSGVDEVSE